MEKKTMSDAIVQAHEGNIANALVFLPSSLRFQLNLHVESDGPDEWTPVGDAGNTWGAAMRTAMRRALKGDGVIVLTAHAINSDSEELWHGPVFEFKL